MDEKVRYVVVSKRDTLSAPSVDERKKCADESVLLRNMIPVSGLRNTAYAEIAIMKLLAVEGHGSVNK
jgi:hypothetical protein